MEKKEYQIGEVFKCEGCTYKCVEGKGCDGCQISNCNQVACSLSTRKDRTSVIFVETEEPNPINWEHRRYELSMAAMQGILADSTFDSEDEKLCKACIAVADEMIKQLQKPAKH